MRLLSLVILVGCFTSTHVLAKGSGVAWKLLRAIPVDECAWTNTYEVLDVAETYPLENEKKTLTSTEDGPIVSETQSYEYYLYNRKHEWKERIKKGGTTIAEGDKSDGELQITKRVPKESVIAVGKFTCSGKVAAFTSAQRSGKIAFKREFSLQEDEVPFPCKVDRAEIETVCGVEAKEKKGIIFNDKVLKKKECDDLKEVGGVSHTAFRAVKTTQVVSNEFVNIKIPLRDVGGIADADGSILPDDNSETGGDGWKEVNDPKNMSIINTHLCDDGIAGVCTKHSFHPYLISTIPEEYLTEGGRASGTNEFGPDEGVVLERKCEGFTLAHHPNGIVTFDKRVLLIANTWAEVPEEDKKELINAGTGSTVNTKAFYSEELKELAKQVTALKNEQYGRENYKKEDVVEDSGEGTDTTNAGDGSDTTGGDTTTDTTTAEELSPILTWSPFDDFSGSLKYIGENLGTFALCDTSSNMKFSKYTEWFENNYTATYEWSEDKWKKTHATAFPAWKKGHFAHLTKLGVVDEILTINTCGSAGGIVGPIPATADIAFEKVTTSYEFKNWHADKSALTSWSAISKEDKDKMFGPLVAGGKFENCEVGTPDVLWDGIVDNGGLFNAPGIESGALVFVPDMPYPVAVFPEVMPVVGWQQSEYMVLGQVCEPWQYLPATGVADTGGESTNADVEGDLDGCRAAYSHNTHIVEVGLAELIKEVSGGKKETNYVRRVSILRPMGSFVVFEFEQKEEEAATEGAAVEQSGDTTQTVSSDEPEGAENIDFKTFGYPIGVNSNLTYVLQYEDTGYTLLFPSGVKHVFAFEDGTPADIMPDDGSAPERLTSIPLSEVRDTSGRKYAFGETTTTDPEGFTSASGAKYEYEFGGYRIKSWTKDSIVSTLTYDDKGHITSITKTKDGASFANGLFDCSLDEDTITYGNGLSVTRSGKKKGRRDVTLLFNQLDASGECSGIWSYNERGELDGYEFKTSGYNTKTGFIREDHELHLKNGLPASCLIDEVYLDGVLVADHSYQLGTAEEPGSGWLTSSIVPYADITAELIYEYENLDHDNATDGAVSNHLEIARSITKMVAGTCVAKTLATRKSNGDEWIYRFCSDLDLGWEGNTAYSKTVKHPLEAGSDTLETTTINPSGSSGHKLSYDAANKLVSSTVNSPGIVSETYWDAYGRLLDSKTTRMLGGSSAVVAANVVTREQGLHGRVTGITGKNYNHVMTVGWPGPGTIKVCKTGTESALRTISQTYYQDGKVKTSSSDHNGYKNTYTYNTAGQLTKQVVSRGNVDLTDTWVHDARGRMREHDGKTGRTTIDHADGTKLTTTFVKFPDRDAWLAMTKGLDGKPINRFGTVTTPCIWNYGIVNGDCVVTTTLGDISTSVKSDPMGEFIEIAGSAWEGVITVSSVGNDVTIKDPEDQYSWTSSAADGSGSESSSGANKTGQPDKANDFFSTKISCSFTEKNGKEQLTATVKGYLKEGSEAATDLATSSVNLDGSGGEWANPEAGSSGSVTVVSGDPVSGDAEVSVTVVSGDPVSGDAEVSVTKEPKSEPSTTVTVTSDNDRIVKTTVKTGTAPKETIDVRYSSGSSDFFGVPHEIHSNKSGTFYIEVDEFNRIRSWRAPTDTADNLIDYQRKTNARVRKLHTADGTQTYYRHDKRGNTDRVNTLGEDTLYFKYDEHDQVKGMTTKGFDADGYTTYLSTRWNREPGSGRILNKRIAGYTVESYSYLRNGALNERRIIGSCDADGNPEPTVIVQNNYNAAGIVDSQTITDYSKLYPTTIIDNKVDRSGRVTAQTDISGTALDVSYFDDGKVQFESQNPGLGHVVVDQSPAYQGTHDSLSGYMLSSSLGDPDIVSMLPDATVPSRIKTCTHSGGLSATYAYNGISGTAATCDFVVTDYTIQVSGGISMQRSLDRNAQLRPNKQNWSWALPGSGGTSRSYEMDRTFNNRQLTQSMDLTIDGEIDVSWIYDYDSTRRLASAIREVDAPVPFTFSSVDPEDDPEQPLHSASTYTYHYDPIGNILAGGLLSPENTLQFTNRCNQFNFTAKTANSTYSLVVGEAHPEAHVLNAYGTIADRIGNRFYLQVPVERDAAGVANKTAKVLIVFDLTDSSSVEAGLLASLRAMYPGKEYAIKEVDVPLRLAPEVQDLCSTRQSIRGTRLTGNGYTYKFDAINRLTEASNADVTETYTYYPDGRRATKATDDGKDGSIDRSTVCYYNGWNLIKEIVDIGPSTMSRDYLWGLDKAGLDSGSCGQSAGGIDGLLGIRVTHCGDVRYYLPITDFNGNIIAYIDGLTGATALECEYSPFGQLIREAYGSSPEYKVDLRDTPRFSSKIRDEATGLTYYGYRYYDPTTFKWLTRDPLNEQGGINMTAFCSNDPINAIDPLGLEKVITNGDSVYWIVQRDGWINENVRQVYIGHLSGSTVHFNELFGGGTAELKYVKRSAAAFWNRPSAESIMLEGDISGYDRSTQNSFIRSYLQTWLNPHNEQVLRSTYPIQPYPKTNWENLKYGKNSGPYEQELKLAEMEYRGEWGVFCDTLKFGLKLEEAETPYEKGCEFSFGLGLMAASMSSGSPSMSLKSIPRDLKMIQGAGVDDCFLGIVKPNGVVRLFKYGENNIFCHADLVRSGIAVEGVTFGFSAGVNSAGQVVIVNMSELNSFLGSGGALPSGMEKALKLLMNSGGH